MNKEERLYLEKVYKDCVKLEKKKVLTQHGAGQADLANLLLKKRSRPFKPIQA